MARQGVRDYGRLSDGVQNKNGKRLIYKLLNNGLSKTLAPTIVINWLRSYPSRAGQAKPKAMRHLLKKGFWKLVTATEASKTLSKKLKQADLNTLKLAAQEATST